MRVKDSVLRTKRARRCRSVVFQRSGTRRFTCFLSDSTVLFFWDHGLGGCPEISETMASTSLRREWPPTDDDRCFGFGLRQRKRPPDDTLGTRKSRYMLGRYF